MNKYLNINLLDKVSLETTLKFVLVTAGTWSRILMVSLVRQQSARSSARTASHLNVEIVIIIIIIVWYSDLVTWPAAGTGCGTLAGAGRRSAAWAGLPQDPFKHKIIKSLKIYLLCTVLNETLRNFVSEHLAYFCVAFCLLNSFVKIFMFTDTAASCSSFRVIFVVREMSKKCNYAIH